jgi:peptidoglycan/LPS O-acetylase OafA/YrhL
LRARLPPVRDSANLDLLRSFAVLCVFCCHLPFAIGRWDGIGVAGVILFFVHTSYVLLLSLKRNHDTWAGFQVRRIFRIYPLAILSLATYGLLRVPYTSIGREYVFSNIKIGDALSNIFLVQNLTGNRSIPGVLWSLPYELQMYLVLPLIFWLCTKYGRRGAIALYISSAIAIGAGLILLPASPFKSTFQVLEFVPCFLAGALMFTAPRRERFRWPGLFIVFAAVAYASTFRRFTNDIVQWCVCLSVATALPFFSEVASPLLRGVFKNIAKYSYGIYLSHYAAIQLALRLTHNPAAHFALSIALTALFSVAAFHLLEQPLINYGKSLAARISAPKKAKVSFAVASV